MSFAANGNGWPPDTNGDVGPNHYIQVVNTSVGIFDKASGAELVAVSFNTFFQGSPGSACRTPNYGDPVALYDAMADRWLVTDFAFAAPTATPALLPVHRGLPDRRPGLGRLVLLPAARRHRAADRLPERLSEAGGLARRLLHVRQHVRHAASRCGSGRSTGASMLSPAARSTRSTSTSARPAPAAAFCPATCAARRRPPGRPTSSPPRERPTTSTSTASTSTGRRRPTRP